MTHKQQNELLLQSILGNGSPDHVSLPEQMVLGMSQFSGLYNDVETEVNNDRNASSTDSPNEFDKKLKECFSRRKAAVESLLSMLTNQMVLQHKRCMPKSSAIQWTSPLSP
jgi:hypothetical protein